jgi:hypothetical protein
MDLEPHLDDEHFNFRTGQPCLAGDDDWYIIEAKHPEGYEWPYVH